MKVLAFLLVPFVLMAQDVSYPDTIVLKNGKIYPCLIKELDNSKVRVIYDRNITNYSGLLNVEKVVIAENGPVYRADSGFIMNLKSVQKYISLRREKEEQELERKREENQWLDREQNQQQGTEQPVKQIAVPYEQTPERITQNRWSFGVLYIPYYSSKIYQYSVYPVVDPYYPQRFYYIIENESKMEGHFSFQVYPGWRLTGDIGYSTTCTRQRDEEHSHYIDYPVQNIDYGFIKTNAMKIFVFNIGLKYYLSGLINQKVSAYLLAGAGKQFAFVTAKSEGLFVDTPPTTRIDDNREEYLEHLNSPLLIFLGFGVEYPFNQSISLFSNIRFYYSRVQARYDYRKIETNRTETKSAEYRSSDLIKRIGLGLNFYF